MFKSFNTTLSAFLFSAAVLGSAPAIAEPLTGQNVSIVSTADLNLSSPAGRAELNHRLVNAAYDVCGTPSDSDLVGQNQARACRAVVLAKARAESEQLANRAMPIRIATAR